MVMTLRIELQESFMKKALTATPLMINLATLTKGKYVTLREISKGILTYMSGLYKLTRKTTGGTNSARYCYSVWLRHLVMSHQHGFDTQPRVIAELGPGDSLGIGLAALLSGADKYYALDIVEYANTKANMDIFDELVMLFTNKERIPDQQEFPAVKPYLQSYEFPGHILTDNRLQQALKPSRVQSIKDALVNPNGSNKNNIEIHYFAPWYDADVIKQESVNMIFSQAVLEHVDDLPLTYEALYRWLKVGGFMSHQIDFGCHGRASRWNGHWAYSDLTWKLIRGKRPYLINRQPYSVHRRLLEECGFEVVCEAKVTDTSGIGRKQLSRRYHNMPGDDLVTRNVHILAKKACDKKR